MAARRTRNTSTQRTATARTARQATRGTTERSSRTASRATRASSAHTQNRATRASSVPPQNRATKRSSSRARTRAAARDNAAIAQGGVSQSAYQDVARKAQGLSARSAREADQSAQARLAGKSQSSRSLDLPEVTVGDSQPQLVSRSIGQIRGDERRQRLRDSSRRHLIRLLVGVGIIVVLLAGWAALYNSPAFSIENVEVNGVEHLTSDEMAQLANVPADSTLLRVDADNIRSRLLKNAWVEDVSIHRAFPNTLVIDVTERKVAAIVEVPTSSGDAVKQWAIAEDHMWLMPIPEKGSEAAKTTSAKVYEDAENALHIVNVPHGTKAEIGQICSDANVNNALDIVAGMTTELANHVSKVSANGTAETTLIMDDGIEIAFGAAEDIRDKERVILKIMEENPDGVAYINVRMVETPTWRAI